VTHVVTSTLLNYYQCLLISICIVYGVYASYLLTQYKVDLICTISTQLNQASEIKVKTTKA